MATLLHITPSPNIPAILAEGLRLGMPVKIMAGEDWAGDWYDENPVFLSLPDSLFLNGFAELPEAEGMAVLEVDASALPLVADLVSLIDHGGRYLPDGYIQWAMTERAGPLRDFLDEDGCLEIEHLLDPSTDMARAAIELTHTAACLSSVQQDRLSILGMSMSEASGLGASLPGCRPAPPSL